MATASTKPKGRPRSPFAGAHGSAADSEVDRAAMILLSKEVRRLRHEIAMTLLENAHLADGDNCTLKRLKRALRHNVRMSDADTKL